MKMNKLSTNEKGQAFILAMVLLLVGALIIAPLLSLMGTGLIAGRANETKMNELYAADSGVELGMWHIYTGSPDLPTPAGNEYPYSIASMNDNTVDAVLLNFSETTSGGIFRTTTYKITATAGGTQVISYITISTTWFTDEGLPIVGGDFVWVKGPDWTDDVYVDGNVLMGDDAEIDKPSGDLYIYADGDVLLAKDAEIEADNGSLYVFAGGSIILGNSPDSEIELEAEKGDVVLYALGDIILGVDTEVESEKGDIFIYAGGNMTMADDAEVETEEGDICIRVEGYLTIDSGAEIDTHSEYTICICAGGDVFIGNNVRIIGDFYVGGDITLDDNARITGDVYTNGTVTLGFGAEITGTVYPYEDCPCGGVGSPGADMQTWEIN